MVQRVWDGSTPFRVVTLLVDTELSGHSSVLPAVGTPYEVTSDQGFAGQNTGVYTHATIIGAFLIVTVVGNATISSDTLVKERIQIKRHIRFGTVGNIHYQLNKSNPLNGNS